jgi:hypothetical protein
MRLRQRAAEHGEVLGEHIDDTPVDRAPAGDDAVAGILLFSMPKSAQRCSDVHVELLEGVLVHEQIDALARGELAALVLRLNAGATATETASARRRSSSSRTSFMLRGPIARHKLGKRA